MTRVELVVVVGLIAILFVLLLRVPPTPRYRCAACQDNLWRIMKAIMTYSADYHGYFPTSAAPGEGIKVATHYKDLGIIYPGYIPSLKVFTCPSSKDRMPTTRTAKTNQKIRTRPFLEDEAMQVSYAYSYNGSGANNRTWTNEAPSMTRILADRPAGKRLSERCNHRTDGRNVAHADGHVKWVPGPKELRVDPDNYDPKMKTESWWSERPDGEPKEKKE